MKAEEIPFGPQDKLMPSWSAIFVGAPDEYVMIFRAGDLKLKLGKEKAVELAKLILKEFGDVA